ncbi:hypothetical protein F4778DRAFT_312303 [Xylariomycetidae sp. FL2044]|nr:hypothetical protein F4778DRAFT_312303 [Xylariomycetidae sp. FL2044]
MPEARPSDAELDADDRLTSAPDAKRRKTRKGTRSCWACKRRKEKCVFDSQNLDLVHTVCQGCQRRGTPCVSQEFTDEAPPEGAHQMGARLARLEAQIENLSKRFVGDEELPDPISTSSGGSRRHKDDTLRPASIAPATPQAARPQGYAHNIASSQEPGEEAHRDYRSRDNVASDTSPGASARRRRQPTKPIQLGAEKHSRLCRTLYDSLPSREDTDVICRASHRGFFMYNEILTAPPTTLDRYGPKTPEDILIRPKEDSHPILMARYMLQLVLVLQQFGPEFDEELRTLSEAPQDLLDRLADAAVSLVTTQDRLLGSIEGVECVMLESMYHSNKGSLRLSWAAGLRAMHLAQLMGFHLSGNQLRYKVLDPKSRADPGVMWFRIIHQNRFLSLLLGLPQGSNDQSLAAYRDESETSFGGLERTHCIIAARLLERKESGATTSDLALTHELDMELQKAARSLPSKWWLTPNLGRRPVDDKTLFWDLKVLITQMAHYNLLNQLHLPYMLRSSSQHDHGYSKIACVSASREILTRFVALRNFDRIAFNCRITDFVALMAAMTLLLAHLDSRGSSPQQQAGNLLAHQYPSDRAMTEQVQESMQEISRASDDPFSTQGADLLRRLLAIDAEAAVGLGRPAEAVTVQGDGDLLASSGEIEEDEGVMCVTVPYFGIIRIAREGIISREIPRPPLQDSIATEEDLVSQTAMSGSTDSHNQAGLFSIDSANMDLIQSHAPSELYDPLLPGLTAGADDWAFQGADRAFFDSLMGCTTGDGYLDVSGVS